MSVPVTAESVLTQQGLKIAIGGTDNHLLLVDLSACGIDGDRASILLEEANIIVNKNRVPGDKGTAQKPFGIRLGSPALTTRGLGPDEILSIARWIADVILHPEDQALRARIRAEVIDLCRRFPIYRSTF